jgi:hypothetical protein
MWRIDCFISKSFSAIYKDITGLFTGISILFDNSG